MFQYIKNELGFFQNKAPIFLKDIARENEGKAFYLYDRDAIEKRLVLFQKASGNRLKVFFAMKANNNPAVLKMFYENGCGLDVVSGGELERALGVGFSPKKIVFSGVGKTPEELSLALKEGVFQINAESFGEIKALAQIAKKSGKKARLALRINPNVDFKTHPYIKTGLSGHKFGFDEDQLPLVLEFLRTQPGRLHLQGLSMHLGSQIFDLGSLFQALNVVKSLYENLKSQGFPLKTLDIGGGLGVDYSREDLTGDEKLIEGFGVRIKNLFRGFEDDLLAEPGRFLVARFGLLCSRVEYIKKTSGKTFVIVNTGMHHFLRPALYGAFHRILAFRSDFVGEKQLYEVVGPICETTDTLARDSLLPELHPGDWLAICDAGAYGL